MSAYPVTIFTTFQSGTVTFAASGTSTGYSLATVPTGWAIANLAQRVINLGPNLAHIEFMVSAGSGVVAVSGTAMPVPAGVTEIFGIAGNILGVAIITTGGATTISFTAGSGI